MSLIRVMLIATLCLCGAVVSWSFASDEGAAVENFVYDDKGSRDPFWSLVTSSGTIISYDSDFSILDLSLEGILADTSGNLAIINGRIVKVNDKIGQFVIIKVDSNIVTLMKGGQKFELRLKKGD